MTRATQVKFERKFGNKMYKLVHVVWGSIYDGNETATRKSAEVQAKLLRSLGFSTYVRKAMLVRYPRRGPELFYHIWARKEGLTLDQVEREAKKNLGY